MPFSQSVPEKINDPEIIAENPTSNQDTKT